MAAGLLMWVTSLHPVRKRFFELFFYTHQLYAVFVVFLAFHVGDFIFSICAGAVFLFMLDRFLRFWQSRAKVDIISAACRPCGTVELVFSKPASKEPVPLLCVNHCSISVVAVPSGLEQLPIVFYRPPLQCFEFHLHSSARAIVLAVAPVQCIFKSHGWEIPHVGSHKSTRHVD